MIYLKKETNNKIWLLFGNITDIMYYKYIKVFSVKSFNP